MTDWPPMCLSSDTRTLFFFDLGGVLVQVDTEAALSKFAAALGVSPRNAGQWWKQYEGLHLQYERGTLNTREWLKKMSEATGLCSELITEIFSSMFSFNRKVYEIAEKLAAHRSVSIISNTNPIHYFRLMCDYPELHLFDDPITSYNAKSLKPEPTIFHYACQRHGRRPNECVFIDDRPENVRAAEDLGMVGVHYRSPDELSKDLYNLTFPHHRTEVPWPI